MARRGSVRRGRARNVAMQGAVRPGLAVPGESWHSSEHGLVWHGKARPGAVWLGSERGRTRLGSVWCGQVRLGMARNWVWQSKFGSGNARLVVAPCGKAWSGSELGLAWNAVRQGWSRLGESRRGMARYLPHMNIIGIDLETASQCDLKVEGALRYSLHPSTIVRCAVIGWVDADGFHSVTWERGDNVPQVWRAAVESGATALAFNYNFERYMLDNVLSKQGWPVPQEWIDPQPHAAAANLPTSLLGLALALGCPAQKDQAGSDLAKKMSFLEDDGSNEYDTPENRAILLAYCRQDVKTMFDCWQRVPKMIPAEQRLWQLDQKINARGVFIDRVMVSRMLAIAEKRRLQLLRDGWSDHSAGDLISSTKTGEVKAFLKSRNVELPKVARTRVTGEKHESETVGRAAAAEIAKDEATDPAVRAVLENRMEMGKLTSLAKLRKVERLIDPRDGRLRNSLQFCAAHTGRWSSRGLQVHNFPRDKRKPEEVARVRKIIEGA